MPRVSLIVSSSKPPVRQRYVSWAGKHSVRDDLDIYTQVAGSENNALYTGTG